MHHGLKKKRKEENWIRESCFAFQAKTAIKTKKQQLQIE